MHCETEISYRSVPPVFRQPIWYGLFLGASAWGAFTFLIYSVGGEKLYFFDAMVAGNFIFCASLGKLRAVSAALVAFLLFGAVACMGISSIITALLAIGFGGLTVTIYYAARGSREDLYHLEIGFALIAFVLLESITLVRIPMLCPKTYDYLLAQMDFGVSAALYHWTKANELRMAAVICIYYCLPLSAIATIAYTDQSRKSHLMRALSLAAVLALPCYLILPAVGPVHLNNPAAPGNCMPSLHMTWASLLWVNSRSGWLRKFTFCFMFLTGFSTLAMGEHYLMDLVAAVPFIYAVQVLSSPIKR